MALSNRGHTTIKVVQATHHQGDVKYGASRGIQCSCVSPISLSCTWLWNKFDLDSILGKGGQVFKIISKFRYLGMEDLYQELSVENCSINVKFLENKRGEIKPGTYLLSTTEIRNSFRNSFRNILLFVNNCVLGLIYLFDSYNKDENSNFSSFGTAVLPKCDTLHSMQSYIKSVYYNNSPLTLYFQVQFIKVDCTASTKNAIKFALKKQ